MATITAISREITYASFPIRFSTNIIWATPTLGRVSLVLAELVVVLVLCFYGLHPSDQWQWEDIGYRTGFIASCQLPLIVLLAGKNNIIGFLVGVSYERLSWLHRWTARILLLTVTIHMGFWFADWYRYDYITVKLTTDAIAKRGFAAWVILVWIVFSSMAPIRRWNYELFVLQHIVTYVGFLAAVYLHLPAEVKVWVWLPIGFVILDRTLRSLNVVYTNILVFHPPTKDKGFWASKAMFEPLDSETTRIVIANPPIKWAAGQHVLLSCHTIAPLQSHPFTIASIPSDGKMVFLVKSKNGGTRKYLRHAQKLGLPVTSPSTMHVRQSAVTIEGPYGRIRPLKQFDSVMLMAGSSGGTFTVPLLRDIVQSWKSSDTPQSSRWHWCATNGAATRYVRFIWVVKSRAQYHWFAPQLAEAIQDVEELRSRGQDVELDVSIYVTCDEDFVSGDKRDRQPVGRGTEPTQEIELPSSSSKILHKEKMIEKMIEDDQSFSTMSSEPMIKSDPKPSCGPNGTCCCQTTIEDEDAISSAAPCECHCGTSNSPTPDGENEKSSSAPISISSSADSGQPLASAKPADPSLLPQSTISMLSGRPHPETLIRKMLEQALGESAVAVCGPRGLVANVRQSVVMLSDERAIHKGTGAQGVYLHTESFDYWQKSRLLKGMYSVGVLDPGRVRQCLYRSLWTDEEDNWREYHDYGQSMGIL